MSELEAQKEMKELNAAIQYYEDKLADSKRTCAAQHQMGQVYESLIRDFRQKRDTLIERLLKIHE